MSTAAGAQEQTEAIDRKLRWHRDRLEVLREDLPAQQQVAEARAEAEKLVETAQRTHAHCETIWHELVEVLEGPVLEIMGRLSVAREEYSRDVARSQQLTREFGLEGDRPALEPTDPAGR